MKLSKENLGQSFQVYLRENQDTISYSPTSRKIEATLIIFDEADPVQPFALGWKLDQHCPKNRAELTPLFRTASCERITRKHIDALADYPFFLWVYSNIEVELLQSTSDAPSLSGARCNSCKQYSDYASANQSDGSFKCWTCQKYPHYGSRIR